MRRHESSRGFTLIELMIVMVLLAIFASFAIPNFTRLIQNNRVESVSNEFYSFLQLARSEAVSRRTTITITASNGVWSLSDTTATLRQLDLSGGDVTVTPLSETALQFQSSGAGADIDYTICRGADFANGFQVSVDPSGRTHRSLKRGHNTQGALLEACS